MSGSRGYRTALRVTPILALLTLPAPGGAQQVELVTDSVSGDFVEMHEESFVVRTDDGRSLTFELPSDTAQARRGEIVDTTDATPEVAHSTYMSREDVLLALEEVQESDETNAVHLHYLTEGMPERRVVVWIQVGEPGSLQ